MQEAENAGKGGRVEEKGFQVLGGSRLVIVLLQLPNPLRLLGSLYIHPPRE